MPSFRNNPGSVVRNSRDRQALDFIITAAVAPQLRQAAACHPTPMNVAGNKPDDELPPPPPPPPPKILEEKSELPPAPLDADGLTPPSMNPNGPRLPFFVSFRVTIESFFSSLDLLTKPMTPTSPGGSPSYTPTPLPEAKSKKTNPLMELVETEKAYVDQLAGIIRVTSTDGLYCVFPWRADGPRL